MPAPALKKIADTCGKKMKDLERYWTEAEKSADDKDAGYGYVMNIVKRRIGKDCVKKLGWEPVSAEAIIADAIVEVTAGAAAEALAVVATVIVQLQSLLEGEEALLGNAPEDIKSQCENAVEVCRTLADSLASSIGSIKAPAKPAPEAEEAPEEGEE